MPSPRMPRWARWAIVGIVVVVSLVVGSGVLEAKPQTPAERAAALEARLKSPGVNLTVAESTSAPSLAVRQQVVEGIAAGKSDAEITALLEARYGNDVLETPPPGGFTDVLWLIPVALGIGIVVAMVSIARRRNLSATREAVDV